MKFLSQYQLANTSPRFVWLDGAPDNLYTCDVELDADEIDLLNEDPSQFLDDLSHNGKLFEKQCFEHFLTQIDVNQLDAEEIEEIMLELQEIAEQKTGGRVAVNNQEFYRALIARRGQLENNTEADSLGKKMVLFSHMNYEDRVDYIKYLETVSEPSMQNVLIAWRRYDEDVFVSLFNVSSDPNVVTMQPYKSAMLTNILDLAFLLPSEVEWIKSDNELLVRSNNGSGLPEFVRTGYFYGGRYAKEMANNIFNGNSEASRKGYPANVTLGTDFKIVKNLDADELEAVVSTKKLTQYAEKTGQALSVSVDMSQSGEAEAFIEMSNLLYPMGFPSDFIEKRRATGIVHLASEKSDVLDDLLTLASTHSDPLIAELFTSAKRDFSLGLEERRGDYQASQEFITSFHANLLSHYEIKRNDLLLAASKTNDAVVTAELQSEAAVMTTVISELSNKFERANKASIKETLDLQKSLQRTLIDTLVCCDGFFIGQEVLADMPKDQQRAEIKKREAQAISFLEGSKSIDEEDKTLSDYLAENSKHFNFQALSEESQAAFVQTYINWRGYEGNQALLQAELLHLESKSTIEGILQDGYESRGESYLNIMNELGYSQSDLLDPRKMQIFETRIKEGGSWDNWKDRDVLQRIKSTREILESRLIDRSIFLERAKQAARVEEQIQAASQDVDGFWKKVEEKRQELGIPNPNMKSETEETSATIETAQGSVEVIETGQFNTKGHPLLSLPNLPGQLIAHNPENGIFYGDKFPNKDKSRWAAKDIKGALFGLACYGGRPFVSEAASEQQAKSMSGVTGGMGDIGSCLWRNFMPGPADLQIAQQMQAILDQAGCWWTDFFKVEGINISDNGNYNPDELAANSVKIRDAMKSVVMAKGKHPLMEQMKMA